MKEARIPALMRDPNRKGMVCALTNAVGGRRHVARAVNGTSHLDRVSSSLGLPLSLRIASLSSQVHWS